ncbi:patatin-like phospholipase family protein [Halosquirtibacter laminarini]|uniref:Patatin-like phospholipase family protein n=1 Tax=Halosquirtibacter laminarini TaxID=3374600 RepID=A0AC61NIN4_9BACT|nr:patatin-like phospholipase family protein [Prolixibacteraceae bacterium]
MIKYFFLLFLNVSFLHIVLGQKEPNESHSPRIGLVLSGGGARGLAHIGVLEVLDSLGVRPDYITGTSMGSIVGGLYAIGYSGKELREIVTSVSWSEILSDFKPLNKVDYSQKEILERSMLSFSITNRRFNLPSGMIHGQRILRLLDSLIIRKPVSSDFNKFPIPFRAVTTDLTTGTTYSFDQGDLAIAMRASMAIPTAFSPIRYKGRVLVDGGVIDNLPIEEARRMGADIIIAVNVGYLDYPEEGDLNNLVTVLNKVSTLYGRNETFRIKDDADVLIEPKLGEYKVMGFSKASEIIAIGKEAGLSHCEDLSSYRSLDNKVISLPNVVNRKVDRIEFVGISDTTAHVFLSRMDFKSGQAVNAVTIAKWMDSFEATNLFHWVEYAFDNYNGKTILRFVFNKKDDNQIGVRVAYHNSTKLEMSIQYQLLDSTLVNHRLLSVLNLSRTPDFLLSLESFFGRKKRVGIEARFMYENQFVPIYEENDRLGVVQLTDVKQYLSVNLYTSRNSKLAFSLIGNYESMKPREGVSFVFLDSNRLNQTSVIGELRYKINSLDRNFLPNRGFYTDVSLSVKSPVKLSKIEQNEVLSEEINNNYGLFPQISVHLIKPLRLTQRLITTLDLRSGLSFNEMNYLDQYVIGGIHSEEFTRIVPVAGIGYGQYLADSYYSLGFGLRYRIADDFFVRTKASWLTVSYGDLDHFNDYSMNVPALDIGVGYRSMIGDIILNFGYNLEDYHSYWNVAFYPFR